MSDYISEILVVDDQEVIRCLLQEVLENEGYRVQLARDGRQALEQARTRRPALILLDAMMPNMDGWQVLAELRADARTASVPIVVMSASLDPSYAGRARAAGSAFLGKPFSLRTVLALMEDLVGRAVAAPPAPA